MLVKSGLIDDIAPLAASLHAVRGEDDRCVAPRQADDNVDHHSAREFALVSC